MEYKLESKFKPSGDQPKAIRELTDGLENDVQHQTLLGVTGSGKTFTIASVIANTNRPVLVLSHNKTLAAQLYGEFKEFFPNSSVEYFVSYYDYYQPEAYLPTSDTYIEKDLSINEEINKLRLSTARALLSGGSDTIVISSVSCLYGMGNPQDYETNSIFLNVGQKISRTKLLYQLSDEGHYSRNDKVFPDGTFRLIGDTVDIRLAYDDFAFKIEFFGNEIEAIYTFDPHTNDILEKAEKAIIYPANIFVTTRAKIKNAVKYIRLDLQDRLSELKENGQHLEAKRLTEKVNFDIEMMQELGYCSGIENYSRYFDGRKAGERPFCLLNYFPDDFITIIDESHVTLPQVHAMYGGNLARKNNLIEYGFRLPSAKDNRPLTFEEFEHVTGQTIYMSATPADYELEKSEGVIVEQIVRPTGLIDPEIIIKSTKNPVDDLLNEMKKRIKIKERILVTTLTKKMAEELSVFLGKYGINSFYIHSDVDTLERIDIIDKLREGIIDVIVGVNLLREGLDLPEVSLVAILDADKEGFLRSARSLTQTAGRAARNINGKVIMYAEKMTKSMQKCIDDTNLRRKKQIEYNKKNNITPKQIIKDRNKAILNNDEKTKMKMNNNSSNNHLTKTEILKKISEIKEEMQKASQKYDFKKAAMLRDQMFELQK